MSTPRPPRRAPMLLEFLQAITGVFVVVYDGQHALKYTLGRAKEVVGPGVRFKLPVLQNYEIRDTRHTTLDLEPQVIQLDDDLVYEVDCKVMYQIVDLRKALIEVDDLVTGLQNRVVMAVQRVFQGQDRRSVRDTEVLIELIGRELQPVEEDWGVRILKLGFSNLSPSPASLEITQLDLLAKERLELYGRFRGEGLAPAASVALITGAVVATPGREPGKRALHDEEEGVAAALDAWVDEARKGETPPESADTDEDDEDTEA